jgi:hypothetical protein
MSLEDRLNELSEYPAAEDVAYTPKTEFDGGTGFIQTGPLKQAPQSHTELLEQFGYDPAEVTIVGNPHVSRWEQRARIRGTNTYDTVWLSAYKFTIAATKAALRPLDLDAIVKKAKKAPKPGTEPHWFVFQASDTQLGKKSRDGSTGEILDRYFQSVESAIDEFKALKRHGIEGIQLSFPGDCIEGNQSQRGRNMWLTQETITEQTRILRRLIMHTVERFAPLVDQLLVHVVGGNHDDADRMLNSYPGNNWATESAISVADALKMNPTAYGHVDVRVPDKWSGHMTVPVGDSVVTIAHGHQWRKGQGMTWWANQAHNNQPHGAAQVLQCGHYHEWHIESSATKTLVQSSTLDCGSDWYRDKTGADARRGALVYLLNGGEVSRMSVL